MGEGYIQQFVRGVQTNLILWLIFNNFLLIGTGWLTYSYISENLLVIIGVTFITALISAVIFGAIMGRMVTKPTRYIAQAILHISPTEHLVAAPNMDELNLGRDLALTLTRQVYSYATNTPSSETAAQNLAPLSTGILDQLPVATIGINEEGIISIANSKALSALKVENLIGCKLDDLFNFNSEDKVSVNEWISSVNETSINTVKSWQKIQINTSFNEPIGYFDVTVSFSKHNASGIETLVTLSDHTSAYEDEDSSINFVAMAVHELRTPITILRGYLEAFEEDFATGLKPEASDYLKKMNAAIQNMTSFITNILNVARINQNQLSLKLGEGDWNALLPEIVNSLRSRAGIYDKQIELRMQPGLPRVAIDRLTVGEVITNLVDNAIKYSPGSAQKITIVSSVNSDGLIETTVQDYGVGIPSSVMPRLFSKFTRNHRNKADISGTGLGLYLSKAIITAHNGNIWAKSKENEGSTFGFTLLPYDQLAKELQNNNNEGIVQGSHGWIKNHSMQRR